MDTISVSALIAFSVLTTLTWGFRKNFLQQQDVVSFILLETIFVSAAIIITCYFYLGHDKFIKVPQQLNFNLFISLTILGILICGSIFALRYLIKYEDISHISPMVGGLKTIMVVVVGILLFKEKFTIKKIMSIVLIILGLFMLLNDSHPKLN